MVNRPYVAVSLWYCVEVEVIILGFRVVLLFPRIFVWEVVFNRKVGGFCVSSSLAESTSVWW